MQRTKLKDRILPIYSKGEEIFNMTSHIVGAVLGIVATTLCVVFAAIHGNGYGVVSGAIYGFTMILLYTMSSIYHGLSPKKYTKKELEDMHYNLDLCGYPHEEEEILEPRELIRQFKEKRKNLNIEIEQTLAKILEILDEDN